MVGTNSRYTSIRKKFISNYQKLLRNTKDYVRNYINLLLASVNLGSKSRPKHVSEKKNVHWWLGGKRVKKYCLADVSDFPVLFAGGE